MTNRRERKREFRQPNPWRRLLAFLCAFELLISVSGETAYAKNNNTIYSAPVTAPIRNQETPQPEEAAETPEPEGATVNTEEHTEVNSETEEPTETETTVENPEDNHNEQEEMPAAEETTGNQEDIPAAEETDIESGEKTETGTEREETETSEATGEEAVTEKNEGEIPPAPEKIYTSGSLQAETEDCSVQINYTEAACIPDETTLTVTQAQGADLYAALKSAAKVIRNEEDEIWKRQIADEGNAFYLLSLTDAEGNEVYPGAQVELILEQKNRPDGTTCFLTGENARILDEEEGKISVTDYSMEPVGYATIQLIQTGIVTKEYSGADYIVTASYGPEANFPANTEMKVREIRPDTPEYALYSGLTEEALAEEWNEITLERYFDITFISGGKEVEPSGNVDVQIVFKDVIELTEEHDIQAVHFENKEAVVIESETDSIDEEAKRSEEVIDTVSFTSDSFSVFGVVQRTKITQKMLAADGNTYLINVTYNQDSGLPVDAELVVTELLPGDERYDEYLQKAVRAALNESDDGEVADEDQELFVSEDQYARFFDIEIRSGDQKIEPEGNVSVSITLADAPEDRLDDLMVVHFTGENANILEAEVNVETGIQFAADSFSVYGIITMPLDQPQGVDDLDERSFTISHNGKYVTSSILTGGNADRFAETGNSNDATVWTFEATGQSGKYNIYTIDNQGNKIYMHLKRKNNNRADAEIGTEPQEFTITRSNNGRYVFAATSNGSTYYLNDYNGEDGFAGWHRQNSSYDEMTLEFKDLAVENGKSYITLVKYNGKYYIVNNDGSLTEVVYNESTKKVKVENPLLWKYENNGQGATLSINTEGSVFGGPGGVATEYYKRYIDVNTDSGIYTEDASHTSGASESKFVFADGHIRSLDGSYYLGVEEDENGLRISGNKNASDAVEVLFASVEDVTVPSHYARNHAVTHLDVSVHGNAQLDYPLPRGTYYDENGNVLYTIGRDNPKSITIKEAVPITKEDIKNADIIATDKNGNEINNAFYITGYTGNQGDNDPNMPTQIRIEGSFLVASNVTTAYPTEWTGDEGEYWGILRDNATHQAIRTERKDGEITYTVTTTKMVTFTLTDGDQILYDAEHQPITVEVPVTMTGSCSYWSKKNSCPGIDYALGGGRAENGAWDSGCIVADGDASNSSGIDFTLGGSTKQAENAYPSVDITKYIVDEEGTLLATTEAFQNSFTVYQIENNNLASECNSDYSAYTEEAKLDVSVAGGVGKNYYDLNVLGAMIYIEEDKKSIPKTVKVDGIEWQYVKTVIETEYVRRGEENESNHRTEELTLGNDEHYNSIPELAGAYRYNNEDLNNAILNFYVYNVYRAPTEINVEKIWSDDASHYESNELTLKLIRYKKNTQQTEEKGILNLSHVVEGLNGLPDDFTYIATSSSSGKLYTLHIGENTQLPLGRYTITVERNGNNCPEGYTYDGTDIDRTEVLLDTASEPVNVTVTSRYRQNAPVEMTTVILYINNSIQTDRNSNVGITLEVPKNSTIYLSCTTFVMNQYNAWDEPCSLLYWDEVSNPGWHHWTKIQDIGKTPMTNMPIQLGDEDAYCVLIEHWSGQSNLATYSLSASASGRMNTIRMRGYRAASGAVSGGSRSSEIPDDYSLDTYTKTITLTQAQGWQDMVDELPVYDKNGDPYYYEVVEEDVPEGYTVSYSPNTPVLATETEGITLTVYNTYPTTGDLLVSKTTGGNAADYNKGFNFTVTALDSVGNPIPNRQYGDMVFTNGIAEFALSHGQSAKAQGLPEGTAFTVREDPDGYEADRESEDGTIVAGQTQNVAFTNILNTYQFFVKKSWVSVEDTSAMPTVFFSLMYYLEGQQPHEATVYNGYENIPLSGPNWIWACPEELPTEINGRRVTYFAKERTAAGSNIYAYYDMSGYDIPEALRQQYMFFIDGYQNSLGNYTPGNDQPYNAGIQGNAGIITIRNRMPQYMQMEVKKKFLEYRTDSNGATSLYTTTQEEVNQRNMVIELQLMRRVIDERPNHNNAPLTGWEEYGNSFKVGHITSGDDYYISNDNVFEVEYAGSPWAFRIPEDKNMKRGLPAYGYYKLDDGTEVPVRFQYVYKEVQVYDGAMNPIGGQWTSWLPEAKDINGTFSVAPAATAQDGDRLLNVAGTSLHIEKEWNPDGADTDIEEVYVKIWRREYGSGNDYEDYLAVIKQEMDSLGHLAPNHFETSSLEVFDADNNRLILKKGKDWNAVIDKVALFPDGNQAKQYEFLIEEVGYKDSTGAFNSNLDVFEPVKYYKKNGNDNDWVEQATILPTRDGTNSLKVTNTLQYGSLQIIKQVPEVSTENAAEESFVFNVALNLPAGTTLNLDALSVSGGTIGEIQDNGTSVEFTVTIHGVGTATINGIPFGTTYTVTEDANSIPEGWEEVARSDNEKYSDSGKEVSNTDTQPDTVTIVNREITSVSVAKVWKVNGEETAWPEEVDSITVGLYRSANGEESPVLNGDGTPKTLTFDKTTNPEGRTFSGLPVYDEGEPVYDDDGKPVPITYTIHELSVAPADDPTTATEVTEEKTVTIGDYTWIVSVGEPVNGLTTITNSRMEIHILKVDIETDPKEPLPGAKFMLKRKNTEGQYVTVTGYEAIEVDENGKADIRNLEDGDYRLLETKSPAGHIPMGMPVEFSVTNGAVASFEDTEYVTYNANNQTFTIGNKAGLALPSTGGSGTLPYTAGGLSLILMAVLLKLMKKRRKKYQ